MLVVGWEITIFFKVSALAITMAPFDDQHTDVPGTVYLVDSTL
jgi:hypothetical protein